MNYQDLIERLRKTQQRFKSENADTSYFKEIGISAKTTEFYEQLGIDDSIEIKGIELLSIEKIKLENEDAVPGIVIFPMGYSVIATTLYGDVYCIKLNEEDERVYIASHDEIYEGQDTEQTVEGITKVSDDFPSFIEMFINKELVASFYDIQEK